MKNQICIVCLRTDRPLKSINTILFEFHDELCEYDLPSTALYYCSECVHLLKKFNKFQKQCRRALLIYKKWAATKKLKRQPISVLCTLLPPSSLGHWTQSSRVATIDYEHDLDPISLGNLVHDNSHPMSAKNVAEEVQEIKLEQEDPTYEVDLKDFIRNVTFTDDADDYKKNDNDDKQKNKNDLLVNNDLKNFTIDEDVDDDILMNNVVKRKINESNDGDEDDENLMKNVVKRKINKSDDGDDEVVKNVDDDDSFDVEFLNDDLIESLVCNDDGGNDDTDAGPSDDEGDGDGTTKEKVNRQHRQIDVARIKANLSYKFSFCGEILTKDGTPIEKDIILKNFPEKVLYHDLRRLSKALRGGNTKSVTGKLKDILDIIQKKFKEDEKYESVFDIQYLSTHEMRVEEFEQRTTYECYITAEYKCNICYTPFKLQKHYKNHVELYHNDNSDGDPCPICKMRISKRIKSHVHSHAAVYKCKMCPLVTYYRSTMLNHFGLHTGKVYRCEKCNFTYKCQSGYFLHMSRFHRSVHHVCATCGRGFSTMQGLTTHAKRHKKDPPITEENNEEGVRCEECDVTFPSKTVYDAHMQDVHDEKLAGTRYYRKPRDSNSLPVYHNNQTVKKKRAPHKMPRVKCRLCNATRLGGGWLKTHFKREHPNENWDLVYSDSKRHLCDVCGSGFTSIYALRDHMTLHTGARPFPCDLCPKHFRTKLLMKEHRYRHFPPTNLCTICGKKFKTKGNLFVHMQGHNGEKHHKCEICGKSFRGATVLKEHVNGVHYNIRRVRKRGATGTHPGGSKDNEQMEEDSE